MIDKPGQYILIQADTNDADYVTSIVPITDDALNKIMPVIQAIKTFNKKYKNQWKHNWPDSEYADSTVKDTYPELDESLVQYFKEEYVPSGGDTGVHTIKDIEVIQVYQVDKFI